MHRLRLLITLISMAALAYAVLEIKSFLNVNFVENETPVKHKLNKFLNGEASLPGQVPAKKQQINDLERSGQLQTPQE